MTLREALEYVGVFSGLCGILWAVIRSLISFAYKKQTEVESIKDSHMNKSIEELKAITDQFEETLVELKEQIIRITDRIRNNVEAQQSVTAALQKFVDSTGARFKDIESELVEIGKDLVMVKSKSKR